MMRSAFLLLAVVASIYANENPRDTPQTTQQPGRFEAEVFITKRPFWRNKMEKSQVDEPDVLITQEKSEAEYWANKKREQHSSDQNPSRIPHKRLRREYNLRAELFKLCPHCDQKELDMIRSLYRLLPSDKNPSQIPHKRLRREYNVRAELYKMCPHCDQRELDMIRSLYRFLPAGEAGLTGQGQRPITEIRFPGDPAKPERGSADGHVTYIKNVGLIGHASAQGELYKSKDGNTVVTGQAEVSKVLVGPAARHSKPDGAVAVQVQHNF